MYLLLILLLGHNDYKVRESAETILVNLNINIDYESNDLETKNRIRRINNEINKRNFEGLYMPIYYFDLQMHFTNRDVKERFLRLANYKFPDLDSYSKGCAATMLMIEDYKNRNKSHYEIVLKINKRWIESINNPRYDTLGIEKLK